VPEELHHLPTDLHPGKIAVEVDPVQTLQVELDTESATPPTTLAVSGEACLEGWCASGQPTPLWPHDFIAVLAVAVDAAYPV
jgi:hypothetical protein